ncbi:MAG: quinone-dependent dihydroorotate dehydrogenase [Patescibacteria group bacterium]
MGLSDAMYEKLLKPLLFKFDPEGMHHFFNAVGRFLGSNGLARWIVRKICRPIDDPILYTSLAEIPLANPLGVGAGFDKEGRIVNILKEVGFGHVEVGTITGQANKGNARPRLWRLPEDNALIVNYGLVSSGADVCAQFFNKEKSDWPVPVGISVAKTNLPDLSGQQGLDDIIQAFQKMQPFANYIVVNVSCPNVGDSCLYCEDRVLYKELLARLHAIGPAKPVYIKLSPELTEERMLQILQDTEPYVWVRGFVLTNLMHGRDGLKSPKLNDSMRGGASGPGLRNKADRVLAFMAKHGRPRFEFIGIGGVDSVDDLYRKIKLGASVVQIVTGLIYHGPLWPSQLMRELSRKLKEDGYKNVNEAVGADLS